MQNEANMWCSMEDGLCPPPGACPAFRRLRKQRKRAGFSAAFMSGEEAKAGGEDGEEERPRKGKYQQSERGWDIILLRLAKRGKMYYNNCDKIFAANRRIFRRKNKKADLCQNILGTLPSSSKVEESEG